MPAPLRTFMNICTNNDSAALHQNNIIGKFVCDFKIGKCYPFFGSSPRPIVQYPPKIWTGLPLELWVKRPNFSDDYFGGKHEPFS